MTVKEVLRKYNKVEIELLLAHVLRKPKEFIFLHPDFILTSKHLNILTELIRRRQKGEPMAYILGYKDFYGLRFKVNRHVLIPRPETEGLAGLAIRAVGAGLQLARKRKGHGPSPTGIRDPIRIFDLGTGSGCIIIGLAKELQKWESCTNVELPHFYGSDISAKALKVAKQNAERHGVKVKFIHSDILQNVRMKFDMIVANLPYGWKEWKNNTTAATVGLKFEPKGALFTGKKGLRLINKLLQQISGLDNKPKFVFLEFDPRQKKDLVKIIKWHLPNAKTKFHKDFNNLWRYAEVAREN